MRTGINNIQWCPWCGDFLIMTAIRNAFKELEINSEDRVVVSWVWCSGKMSQYIDWYWAETLHWRAIPFATGVKLANPKLTVVVVGWDWDWMWIWLWHFLHAARQDVNIVYIICNNENYGLTTWQASPTTPLWVATKTTPNWNIIKPFDPVSMAETAGATFAKSVNSANFRDMTDIIKDAIVHKWFWFINVLQACPSFKRW